MLLDGRQYQAMPHLLLQWRESSGAIRAEFIADFAQASSAANGVQAEGSLRSSGDYSYSDVMSVKQEFASAYRRRKGYLGKDPIENEQFSVRSRDARHESASVF